MWCLDIVCREESEASVCFSDPPAFVDLERSSLGQRDKDKRDIQGGEGQGGGRGQGQERQHEEDEEEDKEEKPDKDEKDICEDYSDKRPMKLVVEYIFIDY